MSEDEERVSNERDAASGDGLEPVDPSAAADAAGSSPAAGAASESSTAGDDKPRTAPPGDSPDQPDATDPDSSDAADKAQIVATQPAAGPVAAGSARAAARRSAAQALNADRPTGSAAPRRKTDGKGTPTPSRGSNVATRPNVFQRLGLFLREVVAELRKVIWPNRNQMVTYTIVVIIFVSFMVALVAGLDLLFARGVLAVFG